MLDGHQSSAGLASAAYCGQVVHQRLHPKRHRLSYSVFCFLIDLDELPTLDEKLRLFSHNRWNLFSIHDRDHGAGDGTNLRRHILTLLHEHGIAAGDYRVLMLSYPRVLGYGFNPITVYFCHDRSGAMQAVIYEVNNTFGERRSYIIATPDEESRHYHGCAKELYVSPFNQVAGDYSFHLRACDVASAASGDPLTVGVSYRAGGLAIMNAHFTGRRAALGDGKLLRILFRYPMMTLKVIAAIHFEALQLWMKGLRLVRRKPAAAYSVTHVTGSKNG